MSEDTARAVGASSPDEIVIAGKVCKPRPLSIKELAEVERDCLKRYKREYLETFSENADLLPDGEASKLIREKLEEVAKWDVQDLPLKWVYDPSKIKVTDRLVDWIKEHFEGADIQLDEVAKKKHFQRLTATALDGGNLSEDDYAAMVGRLPHKARVGYVNWWITGSFDGMITLCWSSFKNCGVTRDEVASEIGHNPGMLVSISREIEHLSSPTVGNT